MSRIPAICKKKKFDPSLLFSMAYRVRQGRNFVTPPNGLSYTGSWVVMHCQRT